MCAQASVMCTCLSAHKHMYINISYVYTWTCVFVYRVWKNIVFLLQIQVCHVSHMFGVCWFRARFLSFIAVTCQERSGVWWTACQVSDQFMAILCRCNRLCRLHVKSLRLTSHSCVKFLLLLARSFAHLIGDHPQLSGTHTLLWFYHAGGIQRILRGLQELPGDWQCKQSQDHAEICGQILRRFQLLSEGF